MVKTSVKASISFRYCVPLYLYPWCGSTAYGRGCRMNGTGGQSARKESFYRTMSTFMWHQNCLQRSHQACYIDPRLHAGNNLIWKSQHVGKDITLQAALYIATKWIYHYLRHRTQTWQEKLSYYIPFGSNGSRTIKDWSRPRLLLDITKLLMEFVGIKKSRCYSSDGRK
jgi:hypothetical protein